jgi:hypothetical protein
MGFGVLAGGKAASEYPNSLLDFNLVKALWDSYTDVAMKGSPC